MLIDWEEEQDWKTNHEFSETKKNEGNRGIEPLLETTLTDCFELILHGDINAKGKQHLKVCFVMF